MASPPVAVYRGGAERAMNFQNPSGNVALDSTVHPLAHIFNYHPQLKNTPSELE